MASRFSRSLDLARASWAVIRADKELLLLPVLSVVALLAIVGSLVVPVVGLGGLRADPAGGASAPAMVAALAFYVVAYFVTIFFNTALVGAAMMRMDGEDPRLSDGLRIAWQRVGRILAYACIAATVGLLLRTLEQRVGWVGRLIVKLVGVGWALATFLVVPVLVTRDAGPLEAIEESARLLKETWGENLIGTVGLGFVFGLAYVGVALVGVAALLLAVQSGQGLAVAFVVVAGVAAVAALTALHAAMNGVYSAALYRYATDHQTPLPGFGPELMQRAFAPRAG